MSGWGSTLLGRLLREQTPLGPTSLPETDWKTVDAFRLAPTEQTVWLLFCLENDSPENRTAQIHFADPFLDLEIYQEAGPGWEEKMPEPEVGLPTVSFTLQSGQKRQYLLRLDPGMSHLVAVPGPPDLGWKDGLLPGSSAAFLVFALIQFFAAGNRQYLHYAGALTTFLIFGCFLHGIPFRHLPEGWLSMRKELAIALACVASTQILFWANSFLGVFREGALKRIPSIAATFFVLLFLSGWLFPDIFIPWLALIPATACLIIAGLSFEAVRRGEGAHFFFVAFLGYPILTALGFLISTRAETDFLPFLDMGIIYQAVLLPVAIADGVRWSQEKKVRTLESGLRDKTESLQRTVEEKMMAQEKAEDASRAKSEFLANMSHEIRTPMNSLLGTADLLSYTKLTEEQRDHLRVFQKAGKTLMNILNDVLDLSRIESEQIRIEKEVFSPAELLRTLELTYSPGPQNEVELRFLAGELPDQLTGDPHRIFQILGNLISNGMKFTDSGWVEVRSEYRDGKLRVQVVDTGIGIPAEKQSRLFQRFYQIRGGQKSTVPGTGLGLSISQSLAHAMEGSIEVESQPGHGSAFTLVLPLEKPPHSIQRLQRKSTDSARRILVVDDNPDNLYLMDRILRRLRHLPICTNHPEEALHLLTENWFDVVVLDIEMPGMDGYELLGEIQQRRLLPENRPVVAITAHDGPEIRQKALQAGFHAHLSKPVRPAELEALLEGLP
ncbi:MAG: response regulator [Leptospiraceae bacterium]|nr:response regulator [Leptospiraceae bacterium]